MVEMKDEPMVGLLAVQLAVLMAGYWAGSMVGYLEKKLAVYLATMTGERLVGKKAGYWAVSLAARKADLMAG